MGRFPSCCRLKDQASGCDTNTHVLHVCELSRLHPIPVGKAAGIGAGWLWKTRIHVLGCICHGVLGVWSKDSCPGGFGMRWVVSGSLQRVQGVKLSKSLKPVKGKEIWVGSDCSTHHWGQGLLGPACVLGTVGTVPGAAPQPQLWCKAWIHAGQNFCN